MKQLSLFPEKQSTLPPLKPRYFSAVLDGFELGWAWAFTEESARQKLGGDFDNDLLYVWQKSGMNVKEIRQ